MELSNDSLLQSLLDFVFPPLCIGCGEYTEEYDLICTACFNSIEKLEDIYCLSCQSPIYNMQTCDICQDDALLLFSYGEYHSALKEMIIQFKFKGITKPAEIFSKKLVEKFSESIQNLNADYLVPIPLTRARENKRGYNQAEVIADHLSILLGIEKNNEILFRVKDRTAQARLPLNQRAENIKSVFAADEEISENYKLILVDDVVTSGSTIKEAAKLLRQHGHTISGIITLAHAFNL